LRQIYFCKAKLKKKKKPKPKCTIQIGLRKKTQKGALHWRSRPAVFIRVNGIEREVLAWDGQIGPVILGGLH
jgi:hypothetical protein